MTRSCTLALAALLVFAGTGRAAESFEDPESGYSATIPDGLRHRYDRSNKVLWLAGGGGLRIRVDTKAEARPMQLGSAVAWYRADGRHIRSKSEALKVIRKPSDEALEKVMGKRPTYSYGFAYKAKVPFRAAGWLAEGSDQTGGKYLQIRVLAYGSVPAMEHFEGAIQGFLASFDWPSPPVAQPTDPKDPPATVVATQPRDEPGEDEETSLRDVLSAARGGGGFDRGSASGGDEMMRDGAVSTDIERNRAFINASKVSRQVRSEEERKRAARYMGFMGK